MAWKDNAAFVVYLLSVVAMFAGVVWSLIVWSWTPFLVLTIGGLFVAFGTSLVMSPQKIRYEPVRRRR